ncbi:TetR/AcrR family transcriptional regulator [Lacrimispora sp.]|uniref:TetR/AcrR family transcriptional regulator n=1 Tax=Lacrimispora sp. TaxID=2719234 RepID=UPI003460DAAE
MSTYDQSKLSLRKRKQLKTRATIQHHALRLFWEQGYDATTVEQIAEAAEISPSTFFRYFPTKEDTVLNNEYNYRFTEVFHAQPSGATPIQALCESIKSVLSSMSITEREKELERIKLIMQVPKIRMVFMDNISKSMSEIACMFAKRTKSDPNDIALRALAGSVIGITISILCTKDLDLNFVDLLIKSLSYLENIPITTNKNKS